MTHRIPYLGGLALVAVTSLLAGCGGDGGGGPSGGSATVAGTVTNALTDTPLAGATVSVGSLQATTDASGNFSLPGVSEGAAVTIQCVLTGFVDYETVVALASGSNTVNIELTRQEVFNFGGFALYAPAGAEQIRGVIVALGGPNTTGFVTGGPFLGAPNPQLEAALQAQGRLLRALATDSGLAILGMSETGVSDGAVTDQRILSALGTAASVSNRPELSSAFLLLLGISGGGPEAYGLTMRLPARVAALLLKVPAVFNELPTPEARLVPTYMNLAANDEVVSNEGTIFAFQTNRALGALWGIAVEPEIGHGQLTDESQAVATNWLRVMVGLRLPAAAGGALRNVTEDSGWLGNRATYEVAPFASYAGDPLVASWLPTQATAQEWRDLVTP